MIFAVLSKWLNYYFEPTVLFLHKLFLLSASHCACSSPPSLVKVAQVETKAEYQRLKLSFSLSLSSLIMRQLDPFDSSV